MKVIQVPFCFYPEAVGGTEVYVESLSRILQEKHGCEIVVVAPGDKAAQYVHRGLRVRRIGVSQHPASIRVLYDEGDLQAAEEFEHILDEEQAEVVHLHAFTRGASLRLVRAAKARQIPVVFTYHTATVSCSRGTMLRWGSDPCSGMMDGSTCTACSLHAKGLPRVAAEIVARIGSPPFEGLQPSQASHSVRSFGVTVLRRLQTTLQMRSLIELRHEATRSLLREVDHIVAVCHWVRDLLIKNGVNRGKITTMRQGVSLSPSLLSEPPIPRTIPYEFSKEEPLRMVYLGRLDPGKGVHQIVSTIRSLPDAPIRLDIFGVAQGASGVKYANSLRSMARSEARIDFRQPIDANLVIKTIRNYHLVVVPSECMETGPLVAMEALAAGVPVLGSRLGGLMEVVRHGVDGLLVDWRTPEAWTGAVKSCLRPGFLAQLGQGIRAPRKMSEVADCMFSIYQQLEVLSRG